MSGIARESIIGQQENDFSRVTARGSAIFTFTRQAHHYPTVFNVATGKRYRRMHQVYGQVLTILPCNTSCQYFISTYSSKLDDQLHVSSDDSGGPGPVLPQCRDPSQSFTHWLHAGGPARRPESPVLQREPILFFPQDLRTTKKRMVLPSRVVSACAPNGTRVHDSLLISRLIHRSATPRDLSPKPHSTNTRRAISAASCLPRWLAWAGSFCV